MGFLVEKEVEEEINIIRTKTKYDEELVSFVSKRDSQMHTRYWLRVGWC